MATDRLFWAAGLQPLAIIEEHWHSLGSLLEREAYLHSLLPAGVLCCRPAGVRSLGV